MTKWWPGRDRRHAPAPTRRDELDARLDAVFLDAVEQRDGVIASRLQVVVTRGVPMRSLEAVPELRAVRLCFADGTRVFGRGAQPGDLGVLCTQMRRHVVVPTRARRDGAGMHLILRIEGRKDEVDVVVTGLDQPD